MADKYVYVKMEADKCVISDEVINDALVTGRYSDSLKTIGWDKLEIDYHSDKYDKNIPYCMGAAEGALTHVRIWNHYQNMLDNLNKLSPNGALSDEVKKWINDNLNFVKNFVKGDQSDSFVSHAELIWQQFQGMLEGYNQKSADNEKLTEEQLWALTCSDDIRDIIQKYSKDEGKTAAEITDYHNIRNHASAIMKLTQIHDEIFLTHISWNSYNTLLRIIKKYNYIIPNNNKVALSFTGHPGTIHSVDGFYALERGVSILSSSLEIMNRAALDAIKAEGIPTWMRVMIAHTSAVDAGTWKDKVSAHMTGSNNNQYLYVDFNKFKAHSKELELETVCVIEHWMDKVEFSDVSRSLGKDEYYALYNVPKFEAAFNDLGYKNLLDQDPEAGFYFAQGKSNRGKLYEKLNGKIHDIDTTKFITRYNNYIADSESKRSDGVRDPAASLAARFDLREDGVNGMKRAGVGAVDGKIISSYLMKHGQTFLAVNGPTTSHQIPAVSVQDVDKTFALKRNGIPDALLNKPFKWVQSGWTDLKKTEEGNMFQLIGTIVAGGMVFLGFLACLISVLCIRRSDFKRTHSDSYNVINDKKGSAGALLRN